MEQNIISCAESNGTSLVLTKNGEIYRWGANPTGKTSGIFIGGETRSILIKGIPEKVIQIVTGENHAMALTKSGEIYSWGGNVFGQLGNGGKRLIYRPVLIGTNNKRIIKIAAGDNHSLALTEEGEVLAWGWRYRVNQASFEKGLYNTPHFVNLVKGKVIDITAGTLHSLALTNDGKVWSWGENTDYQLGDGTRMNRARPYQLGSITERIVSIKAGDYFSLALDERGKVWAWGINSMGQLGGIIYEYNDLFPHVINKIEAPIKKIAAGATHCLAMTKEGEIYGWGGNYWEELLVGGTVATDTPILIGTKDEPFLSIPFGPGGRAIGYRSLERYVRDQIGNSISL